VEATQIAELRTWAQRLEERASNEETRAAAKAILMLTNEVESLQQQLAAATAAAPLPDAEPEADPPASAEPAWTSSRDEELSGSFFSRLKRTFGFQ
jgi:hypothetical protein